MTKETSDSVTAILKACRLSIGLDVFRIFHGSHQQGNDIEYSINITINNTAYRREVAALLYALEDFHMCLASELVDKNHEIYWHLF